jgi:pentatricopeptide repeat protein
MQITKEGCYTDLVVCNAIVDMYAKCGSLEEARNVFDGLAIRDIIGWTSLIAGYADHGTCEEVVGCFEEMQTEGVVPNSLTFVCCLKACANMRDSHMGQRLHSDLVVEGFEDYNFVGNALLSMYARCGMYTEAREVLYHLQSRDVISWTALISEYAEDGLGEEALNVFNEMCEEGVPPNSVTYMCCLKACGSIGTLTKGKRLHIDITKRGLETNPFICNALVDMYAECGKPLELDL